MPAPLSTTTSAPSASSFFTVSGDTATRSSWARRSLAMPIFICDATLCSAPGTGWTQCRTTCGISSGESADDSASQRGNSMYSAENLAEAFRRQAGYCDALGSPLWARLMRDTARDIADGGFFGQILAGWSGDLHLGALPLRLFGGLHYLALSGRSPDLAARLPSTGGKPGADPWSALVTAAKANADLLKHAIESPPQTNEVGRSAVLLGGFLRIAARTRLPFRLREVGSSAGLNLCWDRFSYELGAHRWSGHDPTMTIAADWQGGTPELSASVRVADRRGCDLSPIELDQPEARLWLEAY